MPVGQIDIRHRQDCGSGSHWRSKPSEPVASPDQVRVQVHRRPCQASCRARTRAQGKRCHRQPVPRQKDRRNRIREPAPYSPACCRSPAFRTRSPGGEPDPVTALFSEAGAQSGRSVPLRAILDLHDGQDQPPSSASLTLDGIRTSGRGPLHFGHDLRGRHKPDRRTATPPARPPMRIEANAISMGPSCGGQPSGSSRQRGSGSDGQRHHHDGRLIPSARPKRRRPPSRAESPPTPARTPPPAALPKSGAAGR